MDDLTQAFENLIRWWADLAGQISQSPPGIQDAISNKPPGAMLDVFITTLEDAFCLSLAQRGTLAMLGQGMHNNMAVGMHATATGLVAVDNAHRSMMAHLIMLYAFALGAGLLEAKSPPITAQELEHLNYWRQTTPERKFVDIFSGPVH